MELKKEIFFSSENRILKKRSEGNNNKPHRYIYGGMIFITPKEMKSNYVQLLVMKPKGSGKKQTKKNKIK